MWFHTRFMPGQHAYTLVPDDAEAKGLTSTQLPAANSSRHSWLKTGLVSLLILCSFLFGRITSSPKSSIQNQLGLETVDEVFIYNDTYAQRPSFGTNSAWNDLFPDHGGFFMHPTLAKKRSALSVFHQIHCLNEIRAGYWKLSDEVHAFLKEDTGEEEHTHRLKRAAHEHSPAHTRHCIDLLRQSLMCNADLTVELKDEFLGGVAGFGTSHRCLDWEGLLEWIKPYENIGAPPHSGKHPD